MQGTRAQLNCTWHPTQSCVPLNPPRDNTGNKAYKLIDLEKWAAGALLNFDPATLYDINDVMYPGAGNLRPATAATRASLPLCYKIVP